MKRVFELPAYRRLLAAYTLNQLAVTIGSLALALLVYERTGSAIGAAAYFLCAMFVPALISPIVVARLDQRSSRPVLVSLYGLEALVFALLAWMVGRFSLVPVLILALVDGIFAVTARALARAATVSVTSAAGLLREGNALTNASFSVCYMIGPALGGVAVALGGTVTALLVCAAVFALNAFALATATNLPGAAPHRAPTKGRLWSAVRYARGEPVVRALMGLQAAALLFGTIATPVEVVLADHTLHGGASGYGALLSGWGAGAVVGSLIYARWRSSSARTLIAFGAGCLAIGFGAMAIAPSLALAIAGAAVAGVGNGITVVAARTALQEAVRESWMALMMSLNESIYQAVPGAGILVGGALAVAAGPRAALATAGIGFLVVGAVVWATLRPRDVGGEPVRTAYEADGSGLPSPPVIERQAEPAGTV